MNGDMILVEDSFGLSFSYKECRFCVDRISVPYYRSKDEGDTPGKEVDYIHKACADLPPEIEHQLHPGHSLIRLRSDETPDGGRCNCCGGYGFVYYSCLICTDYYHQFVVCIRCALKLFPITHQCHPHPLVPVHNFDDFSCVVCRKDKYGISYWCTTCPFRVHQNCVSSRIVKLPFHGHEVRFIYSLPQNQFVDPICCRTCKQEMEGESYGYHCGKCRFFFHTYDCRPAVLFIHDASFALAEDEEVHDEFVTDDCYACQSKISVPYYFCSDYLNRGWKKIFVLHKFCAELPRILQHQLHPEHPLTLSDLHPLRYLIPLGEDQTHVLEYPCSACHLPWKGFSYSCAHASCRFTIDAICAMKTTPFQHESHQHLLFLSPNKAHTACCACNTYGEGPSCQCTTCRFWVHQKCASLPKFRTSRLHPHKLKLCYSLEENNNYHYRCQLCREEIKPHNWAYRCAGCRFFTHVHDCLDPCREMEEFDYGAALASAAHLPPANESVTLEKLFFMGTNQEEDIKEKPEPLDADGKDNSRKVTFLDPNKSCHECVGFLAAPCKNCALCEFFLLKSRAELKDPSTLFEAFNSVLSSTKNCDGFSISIFEDIANIKISSSVLPRYVKQEGHSHLLSTTYIGKPTWCNACENDFAGYGFKCNFCDFTIDSYCALLPGSILHKSDKKHPFKLTFYSIEGVEEYVCEICEGDITTRWFYHCVDCDYSIHPRCIWKYHIKFGPFIIMGSSRHKTVLVPSTTRMPSVCAQCDEREVSGCHYSWVLEDFSAHVHLQCNKKKTYRWRWREEEEESTF